MAVGEDAWTRIANCFGAAASDFGSNTAKKFGANVCHWMDRMLVTIVGMSTPCTFQVIVSCSLTPISTATPESSDTWPSVLALPPGAPNHLPDTSRSDAVSESRKVERNSRRNTH